MPAHHEQPERTGHVTEPSTITPFELTAADQVTVDSYTDAVREHIDTMAKVIYDPTFSAVSAHRQAVALTSWWTALGLLADRVTPGDPAASSYVDDQRVQSAQRQRSRVGVCGYLVVRRRVRW
jgi:hypothetical protein